MGTTIVKPDQAAQDILSSVWTTVDGDVRLPVDPFFIAEALDMAVFIGPLDEGVSGMLRLRPGQDPEIYLQDSDSRNRQRFTCAHEIGHYMKLSAEGADDWERVEHRALLASQGNDPDEIYANKFAASLLMPRGAVKKMKDQLGTPAAMAFEFGVSADAMNFRLVNLGLK